MKKAIPLLILIAAPLVNAESEDNRPGEPYYNYSENTQWYDSYGRLKKGYQDAPMRQYPFGKEPYYYYSDSSSWYDSYGRLRYGPRGIPAKEYRRGQGK